MTASANGRALPPVVVIWPAFAAGASPSPATPAAPVVAISRRRVNL